MMLPAIEAAVTLPMSPWLRRSRLLIAPLEVSLPRSLAPAANGLLSWIVEPVMVPAVRLLIESAVRLPARSPVTAKFDTSVKVPRQLDATAAADTFPVPACTFQFPDDNVPPTFALLRIGLPTCWPLPLSDKLAAKSPADWSVLIRSVVT